MKIKWVIAAVLVVFCVLLAGSESKAVSTGQIDEVRKKQVLESGDMQIIDQFVGEAVQELVKTRQFEDIAKLRTVILARRSSQGQYAQQFSESALKHIDSALQRASRLPEDRRIKVQVNLLILINGLEDVRLADLPVAMLRDKNMVIRYWAVRCLANGVITDKLNAGGTDSRAARLIAERLSEVVSSSSPEVLGLMAQFAAAVKIPQGQELLVQIADSRIQSYSDWTVKRELLDSSLLRLLSAKIPSGGANRADLARRFGQLYSYAIQRYVNGRGSLTQSQRRQLASVLVQTEEKCIGPLLARPQLTIRRAVEQDDYNTLLQEHDRLLGSETAAGQLAQKLKFDYLSPRGTKRTAPIPLPKPPEDKSQETREPTR